MSPMRRQSRIPILFPRRLEGNNHRGEEPRLIRHGNGVW